jgi:hypothetical protein
MLQGGIIWNGCLRTIALLIAATMSSIAFATEDDKEPPAVRAPNQEFMLEESNFDQWIFQGSGSAAAGRNRIDSHLKLKLEELVRTCELTEAQQKKLRLAAQGDIKRFFDQVEVLRKKFRAVKNDQNGFNDLWPEIHPLQQKQQAGLFGESSMFDKTLRSILLPEQQQRYQKVTDTRRRFRYRASIEVALISLSDTVALKDEQHKAIAKLLVEETPLPLRFGQQDQQVVMYGLSKIPAAKLKAIVDERQWKALKPQIEQGEAMEAFLAQNGLIEAPKVGAQGLLKRALGGLQMNFIAVPAINIEAAIDAAEVVKTVPDPEGADLEQLPADALSPVGAKKEPK